MTHKSLHMLPFLYRTYRTGTKQWCISYFYSLANIKIGKCIIVGFIYHQTNITLQKYLQGNSYKTKVLTHSQFLLRTKCQINQTNPHLGLENSSKGLSYFSYLDCPLRTQTTIKMELFYACDVV